jgi:murein L,D-transpeptidase YafK
VDTLRDIAAAASFGRIRHRFAYLVILLATGFLASTGFAQKGSVSRLPPVADRIVVDKSDRALYLFADGEIIRTMNVALGLVPEGHKQQEGDFRTPEGRYHIEAKNPDSDYFLSLKISYPNQTDRERARRTGVDPGGQIMIHGLPNEPRYAESRYLGADWTDGCIAVSNSDMIDLWLMTPVATPIEIRP